jgi:hypothetical protein
MHISRFFEQKEHHVVRREMKMPANKIAGKDNEMTISRQRPPETERYLLQVDRQTKGSYKTAEAPNR